MKLPRIDTFRLKFIYQNRAALVNLLTTEYLYKYMSINKYENVI